MYTEWTTTRVLVMEWIEGERLRTASSQAPAVAAAAAGSLQGGGSRASGSSTDASAAVRQRLIQQHRRSPDQVAEEDLRLVEIGVRCSLEQMLEEGFYHAGRWRCNSVGESLLRGQCVYRALLSASASHIVGVTTGGCLLWHPRLHFLLDCKTVWRGIHLPCCEVCDAARCTSRRMCTPLGLGAVARLARLSILLPS